VWILEERITPGFSSQPYDLSPDQASTRPKPVATKPPTKKITAIITSIFFMLTPLSQEILFASSYNRRSEMKRRKGHRKQIGKASGGPAGGQTFEKFDKQVFRFEIGCSVRYRKNRFSEPRIMISEFIGKLNCVMNLNCCVGGCACFTVG